MGRTEMRPGGADPLPALCTHCGLPAGRSARDRDAQVFCCYGCRLAYQIWAPSGTASLPGSRAASGALARLMLSLFFAMASMTFSIALYASALYPPPEGSVHALGPLAPLFQWLAVAFAAPVLLLLGGPILLDAVSGRERRMGTGAASALIVAGVLASYALSLASLLRGEGEVYAETAIMLLVLLTLGRYLDARARERTTRAVRDLLSLDPRSARRLPAAPDATGPAMVPLEDVARGDVLRVLAGERVPVDGRVVDGCGAADEAVLTGESHPRELAAGDGARAGAILVDGRLDIRAEAVLGERLLDRIAEATARARSHRMPLERLAETVSRWFLPAAILVSAGSIAVWQAVDGWEEAILKGLAVLLISCPCALGLATPLAAWVAIGRAARGGILVRGSDVFEALAKVQLIFFDKTGTLTSGRLEVARSVVRPGAAGSSLLRLAGALASQSPHPASAAIRRHAIERGAAPADVLSFRAAPGLGLSGLVDGERILLGNRRHLEREMGPWPPEWDEWARGLEASGKESWAYTGRGSSLEGALALREEVRPEAHRVIEELRALGLEAEVLTGDTEVRAKAIEEQLGLPVRSGLLPADKAAVAGEARRRGSSVAMVGDGHNDAPVLASADVAIAMGSGTEIAREMADVVLLEDRGDALGALPRIVTLSRETVRRIRLNLFWAFAYNTTGMALAACGLVHPVLAAALMIASSLFVVAISTGREPASRRGPPALAEEESARVPGAAALPAASAR